MNETPARNCFKASVAVTLAKRAFVLIHMRQKLHCWYETLNFEMLEVSRKLPIMKEEIL